jgi:hypothetical protein
MAEKPNKLQAPVLMAYLREQPTYPSYAPSWAPLAGWVVFAVSALILELRFDAGFYGLVGGAVMGGFTTAILRQSVKPKNHRQKAEEEICRVIRELKEKGSDGRLHKCVPLEVLATLEKVATIRIAIVTKLRASDPHGHEFAIHQLDEALDACLRASSPVIRRDDTSRREWEALLANQVMIGAIMDTIEAQGDRMQNEIDPSQERSQALNELNAALYLPSPHDSIQEHGA